MSITDLWRPRVIFGYFPHVSDSKPDVPEKYNQLLVSRDENWVKATGLKLKVVVEKMATLVTHSNFRVRQALCDWAKAVLVNCMK